MRARPHSIEEPSRRGLALAIPLLLVAAVAGTYAPSVAVPFFFDDVPAIVENPRLAARPVWRALETPPQSPLTGRPIAALSLALNHAWGRLEPWGYHAVNLALHALNSLLLWGIARATFRSPLLAPRLGAAADSLASAIALLWAVHPLGSEAVVYTIQRTELLMAFFLLLTLHAAQRSWSSAWPGIWCAIGVVACALGMASKEVMVSAPILVLLHDRIFRALGSRELFRRRWRFYLPLAATWGILALLVATGTRSRSVGADSIADAWRYLAAQCAVILEYLRLCVWPAGFCIDHGESTEFPRAMVIAGGAVLASILVLTLAALRRAPAWSYPGLWFFMILAPTSSVLPIASEVGAERRMYLPLAAVVAAIVAGARAACPAARRRVALGAGLTLLVAAGLLALTRLRIEDYRTEERIWQDAIAKRPDNPRPYANLGAYYVKQRDTAKAIGWLERAIAIEPRFGTAYATLGDALVAEGRIPEAIRRYEEAVRLIPDHANVYNAVAKLYLDIGQARRAMELFRRAVELNPELLAARSNLAVAQIEAGEAANAVETLREVLRRDPSYADGHANLGHAWLALGNRAAAIDSYRTSLRIDRKQDRVHNSLGRALAMEGKVDEAIAHYRSALELNPRSAKAHNNLGNALLGRGALADAEHEYRAALDIDPTDADTRGNLGVALAMGGRHDLAAREFISALERDPRNVRVLLALGTSLLALERIESAERAFRTAVEVDPSQVQGWLGLAEVSMRRGNLTDARSRVAEAQRLDPRSAAARALLERLDAAEKK